ncbi:hypothetical protein GOP47_0023491 [Adiantum capillus-veneris]|uniref:Uncharacterized protein n=1 Tax=Adiantum capillus-veneris TaxID=13818 RepID=A0A9D4Z5Y9_ADICA|nr:hypothetical protein GOP47_0023491 [Adiantum capillus-veneris]
MHEKHISRKLQLGLHFPVEKKTSLVDMWPIGKIKLIVPPKPIKLFDLWSGNTNESDGRLRLRDIRAALDADVIFYVDKDGFEVLISAHDRGAWKGYSTALFKCEQELVVVCRKDSGRRAMKAIVPVMPPPNNSRAGPSGILLKDTKDMERVLELRKQLQEGLREIDEKLERRMNGTFASERSHFLAVHCSQSDAYDDYCAWKDLPHLEVDAQKVTRAESPLARVQSINAL